MTRLARWWRRPVADDRAGGLKARGPRDAETHPRNPRGRGAPEHCGADRSISVAYQTIRFSDLTIRSPECTLFRNRSAHGTVGRSKGHLETRAYGRSRHAPKGRQVDEESLAHIRALLGDRPRRRDLLIEHLHLVQDRYGHLSAAHIAALAEEMRLAQTEVYEVATFYAHFDVVKEGETPPPELTVRVCDPCPVNWPVPNSSGMLGRGSRCVQGSRGPCALHGQVRYGANTGTGHNHVDHATLGKVQTAISTGQTHARIPNTRLESYRGIRRIRDALEIARRRQLGRRATEGPRKRTARAGRRGFSDGKKWGFVRANPGRGTWR